jgi:hypothetical protein
MAGFRDRIVRKRPGRRVSLANISFKLAAGAPEGFVRDALSEMARASVLPGSVYLNFWDGMVVAARRE